MSKAIPSQADNDVAVELLKHFTAKVDTVEAFQALLDGLATARKQGKADERTRVCSYGAEMLPKAGQWFVGDIERGEHDKAAHLGSSTKGAAK